MTVLYLPQRAAAYVAGLPRRLRTWAAELREALAKPRALLLSGKPVRMRSVQSLYWSVLVGLVFGAAVFGLYDAVTQVAWVPGHSLKASWDSSGFGLVHSGNWPRYRHLAFRDVAGPAIATMGIATLLSKPRWWNAPPASPLRILTAPLVIITATFALGVLGVYLVFFGLPDAWHHLFGAYTVPGTKWLGYLSAGNFIIGFVITKVLHRYWAPVGATLNGFLLDRSVDRWQRNAARHGLSADVAVSAGEIPAWEKLPLAPPVLRERFAVLWRTNATLSHGTARTWAYAAVIVVFALLVILGMLGHYVAGHGISVPYLFPGA
jgi:hypothetical protein